MLLNTITLGAEFVPRPPINRSWIVTGTSGTRPPAVEGYDFKLTELDTNFQALRNINLAFNLLPRWVAGETRNLYFRMYFGLSTQVALWGSGRAFSRWLSVGWHTMQLEYRSDGQNKYLLDGAQVYAGPIIGVPDFYWAGAQTILLDVGNRGGSLPAGTTWY